MPSGRSCHEGAGGGDGGGGGVMPAGGRAGARDVICYLVETAVRRDAVVRRAAGPRRARPVDECADEFGSSRRSRAARSARAATRFASNSLSELTRKNPEN
eukprot:29081-Pelagococcus_subviridis.AAC.15